MTKSRNTVTTLRRLLGDRGGNFAIITAAVIPLILFGGGVAIDLSQMQLNKNKLQDATDAAALATASQLANKKILTTTAAEKFAKDFIAAQMQVDQTYFGDDELKPVVKITETPQSGGGKSFKVEISAKYKQEFNALTRLWGHESATLAASGTTESSTESKASVSMFIVLDRSGSMAWATDEVQSWTKKCQNHSESNWYTENLKAKTPCYYSKIASLKEAVNSLFSHFKLLDPENKFVRTGASSYNDKQVTPSSNITWGTAVTQAYVENIPVVPLGGTDSSGAFETAYDALAGNSEKDIHKNKTGQKPKRYILFMTDGKNTHYRGLPNTTKSNEETLKYCNKAKAEQDDPIEIYTVAFDAPEEGKSLLKACATSPSHYKEAGDKAALVAAFSEIGAKAAGNIARLTK